MIINSLCLFVGEGVLDSRSELGTVIDLAEWERKSLIRFHCSCEHIKDNAEFVPR